MKSRIALALAALLIALSSTAFAQAQPPTRIEMHESGDHVAALQRRLMALGFMEGGTAADGIYGDKTREAVKTFKDLLLMMDGDDSASASGRFIEADQLAILNDPDFVGYAADLKQGDEGGLVRRLQRKLGDLGYLGAEQAVGVYGDSTAAAVRAFRRLNNLPAGDVADRAVQTLLYGGGAAALAGPDGQPYTAIAKGEKGDRVAALQTRLIELGYMLGTADGDYGDKTQAAVKALADHLAMLDGDETESSTGRSIDAYAQYVLDRPSISLYLCDLKAGDDHAEVERLKRFLVAFNYLDGEIDRTYDENVENAVKLLQSTNGLAVTGVADRATQDLLTSGRAIVSDHSAPRALAIGDSGKQVRQLQGQLVALGLMPGPGDGYYGAETESALSDLKAMLIAAGETQWADIPSGAPIVLRERIGAGVDGFVEELRPGGKGEQVRRLQRRLNALAYLGRRSIDGQFGKGTKEALIAFQQKNGIEATGVADRATQNLLFGADAVEYQSPFKLVVSIDDQKVYAYQLAPGGRYVRVREMICSTGVGTSTPIGVFVGTTGPARRWHYFTDFDCWAQYVSKIEGDILFHSVLFYERDERTLQWGTLNKLGRKASHGCIRLRVEDAKWVWENCGDETIVVIE